MKRKLNGRKRYYNNTSKYWVMGSLIILLVLTYLTLYNNINIESPIKDLFYYAFHRIDSYDYVSNNLNNELVEENTELKNLLKITESLNEFAIINGTVIERNTSYWFNTLTINKGTDDGIEEDMAVITSGGLIGSIDKVSKYSATVKLITSNSITNKISVTLKSKDKVTNKVLSTDSNNNLIVTGIPNDYNIAIGDIVETSGLSEKFPKGIIIGNVVKVTEDNYGSSKVAYIKLSSNIDNFRYVSVLKRG